MSLLIQNWLADRSQNVILNRESSLNGSVSRGFLLGLVLSQKLFSIFINDLEENKIITDKVCG